MPPTLKEQAPAEITAFCVQGGLFAIHVEVGSFARGQGEGTLAVGFLEQQFFQPLAFSHWSVL
jgi:hypothetical protein